MKLEMTMIYWELFEIAQWQVTVLTQKEKEKEEEYNANENAKNKIINIK